MSDQLQPAPQSVETLVAPVAPSQEQTGETATETETEALTLATVKRVYFSPDEAEKAVEHVSAVVSVTPADALVANFDLEADEIPEGWGIAVVPISKRVQGDAGEPGTTVNLGVCIAKVPSPELILSDEAGQAFVRRTLMDSCISQIANAARPDKDTGAVDTDAFVPKELKDFITIRAKGEGLKTFNELAPDVLKLLKKKSPAMKFLNATLLRQALQNAAWATNTLPNIPQEHWEKLLNAMISMARKKEKDPSILQQWLARRNQAEMEEIKDEDFMSAIASLK